MNKKLLIIILILITSFFPLTGCWDQRDLSEMCIVTAIAIDKDIPNNQILLTLQIVRTSALRKQGAANEASIEIFTSPGNTLFEAVRNSYKELDRENIFSHAKVIVVSEEIARDGLKDLTDFFLRSNEIRRYAWLVVAHGSSAKNVLGVKNGLEGIQGLYMAGIIKQKRTNYDVINFNLLDFINKMDGDGINPVTGTFKILTNESLPVEEKSSKIHQALRLQGGAVFRKDKLIGYLNYEDARGFNFATGNVKNSSYTIPSIMSVKKTTSIEIKKITSKITPNLNNGDISFNLHIKALGNITEVGDNTDVSSVEEFHKVEDQLSLYIKKDIINSVTKIQKVYQSDILGFGTSFSKKYPKEWNTIKSNWDTIFPYVTYKVEVQSDLKHTGLMMQPLKPGAEKKE